MTDTFTDYLLRMMPAYDEAILKDITPTSAWIRRKPFLTPLAVDARFLPPKQRGFWLFWHRHPGLGYSRMARKFNLKKKTVVRRLEAMEERIDARLKRWLNILPKDQRRRERYARLKSYRQQQKQWKSVVTCKWPAFTDLKSDWPPSKIA